MTQTFANLPVKIEEAITSLLSHQTTADWVTQAIALHERYVSQKKNRDGSYLKNFEDSLAYLAMRVPATYAQAHAALSNAQELLPSWKPKTVLDIGSGPGTAVWAAHEIWPTLKDAVCLDKHHDVISLGKQIAESSQMPINLSWKEQDIKSGVEEDASMYDVVILANVLNELSPAAADKVIGQAFNKTNGLLIIVEPGTPLGSAIVQNAATKLSKAGTLLAPFVKNSLVQTKDYYLHFPQKFIRPDFERRIRQHMRESSLMASDWEEAKYSYVIISKIPAEREFWGRIIGPVQIQKGFLEISVLTKDAIEKVKVMKRNKEEYNFTKDLKWGELLKSPPLPLP